MVQSCGAVAARRWWRTTPPPGLGATGVPRTRVGPADRAFLVGGCTVRQWGRARAPCAVPCAVPGRLDRASRHQLKTTCSAGSATLRRMTVRDLLAELQHVPATWRSKSRSVRAHAGDLSAARAHAGLQWPAEGILAHQGNELIRHGGWAHLGHGADRNLAFGLQPAVEHAQAPRAVCGRGRLPAGELVGDQRLDVLAPRLFQLDASGREERGGQPERVEVRLNRAAGLFSARRCSSKERTRSATLGSAMTGRYPRTGVESDDLAPLC